MNENAQICSPEIALFVLVVVFSLAGTVTCVITHPCWRWYHLVGHIFLFNFAMLLFLAAVSIPPLGALFFMAAALSGGFN